MARRKRERSTAWDVPIVPLLVAGVLAVGLAVWGWLIVLPDSVSGVWRWEVAIYRALGVNTMSDQYGQLLDYKTAESWSPGFWLLFFAKWLGVGVFFATLAKVVIALFAEHVLTIICRCFWARHVVVIGDGDFAGEVASEAAETLVARRWFGFPLGTRHLNVVHFKPGGRETTRDGILTLDSDMGLDAMLRTSAAHRARAVVFAFDENATSIERARRAFNSPHLRSISGEHSLTSTGGTHIFAFVSDGWFENREALEIDFQSGHSEDAPGEGTLDSVVELISESRCAARSVLAAFPLYALQEHPIQHVLLVGFGAMGEAMLTEICETQRVDPYRRQKITLIDPDRSVWDNFQRRCPEWEKVFDGAFIESDLLVGGKLAPELVERLAEAPLTAAYIATGEAYDPAMAAANLKEGVLCEVFEQNLPAAHARFHIFTCVRGGSATLSPAMREKARDTGGMPIIAFGAWGDIITSARVLELEPDERAFDIHKVNSLLHGGGKPVPNWSAVSEADRYSSRSAAAFLPTLLHAARFDLSKWRLSNGDRPPSPNRPPRLSEETVSGIDAFDRLHMARLEHVRFCAERRLRGFRYRPHRDRNAKLHPSLVAFDALPPKEQAGNLDYIDSVLKTLRAGKGAAPTRLSRREEDAGRPPVRPGDVDLLRRAGRLSPGREARPAPAAESLAVAHSLGTLGAALKRTYEDLRDSAALSPEEVADMARFRRCLDVIVHNEGGYSNHAADRGGATNIGVTQATYNRWRDRSGLPARDVRDITWDEIEQIYHTGYWLAAGCDRLSRIEIALIAFDAAVNHGPSRAIRFLQRGAGLPPSQVDGAFGPRTLAAIEATDPARLARMALDARWSFFEAIMRNDPSQEAFRNGWRNRVEHLRDITQRWASGQESISSAGLDPLPLDQIAVPVFDTPKKASMS